jgi:hypothetical protein
MSVKMFAAALWLLLIGCGTAKPAGEGPSGPDVVTATTSVSECAGLQEKLLALYQQAHNGKGETVVADNAAMVMADCKIDPSRIVPCVKNATTAAELTKKCTLPIDDAGTEGVRLFGNR